MGLSFIRFRHFHLICVRSFFIFRFPVFKIMASLVSNEIDKLVRRLDEAERRAKILNKEVKSIKQEILVLKNSVSALPSTSGATVRQLSTAAGDDEDDGPPLRRRRTCFNEQDGYATVYTDGACENNGKPNAKAGIGVWFDHNHPLNISKPVEGRATNNTAEIQACVEALEVFLNQGESKVRIFTDSLFTINCMTKWINNWKKNNWKTASGGLVKNKEDLQKLDELISQFDDVTWTHVAGHRGITGNEEADKLARQGALRYKPS